MSSNSAPHCILRICPLILLFGLIALGFVEVSLVSAQPVHPLIQLNQPSPFSSNALGNLQNTEEPAIGLYLSRSAFKKNPEQLVRAEEAIQQWEYLLIGLQLPYVLISDSLFSRSLIGSLDILVVPAPETLPDSSLLSIQHFVQEGGGVIASGYYGPSKKQRSADEYMKELAGIKELISRGPRTGKIRQKLLGGHSIGQNLPIGFELDLLSSQTAYVAVVGNGEAVGPAVVSGELQSFTCMVTNSFGKGKVVWMGFSPQDVPPNEEQQRRYQEIVLDAFVFISGSSYSSLRRWPFGYQSATSFVQLPSSGYQPFSYRTSTDLLLNAFTEHRVKATYFVVLQHAQDHPDLLQKMVDHGELGLVSDSQKPLSGLTEDLQFERLSVSKWYLEGEYGKRLHGVLPPGYFYDANTLHVLSRLDVEYMLSDARHYQEPVFLEWEDELDYRDSLVVYAETDSLTGYSASSANKSLIRIYPTLFSYDLDVPLSEVEKRIIGASSFQERWTYRLEEGFNSVHHSGGLFVSALSLRRWGLANKGPES